MQSVDLSTWAEVHRDLTHQLSRIASPWDDALAALLAGRAVIIVGRAEGETPHFVVAAELSSPEVMAFVVRHSSGFVCVAMPDGRAAELELPLMAGRRFPDEPSFAVSVDARTEGTGISAADRSHTARLLAKPGALPTAFTRPGHVVPIRVSRARPLEGWSIPDAASALCGLAGLEPVAVIAAVVAPDGDLATSQAALKLSREADVPLLDVDEVVERARFAMRSANADLPWTVPTAFGPRNLLCVQRPDGGPHLVVLPDSPDPEVAPLVRIRSAGPNPIMFGSYPGRWLDAALQPIAFDRHAVLIALGEDAGDAVAAVLAHLGIRAARVLASDAFTAGKLSRSGVEIVHRVTPVEQPGDTDEWWS